MNMDSTLIISGLHSPSVVILVFYFLFGLLGAYFHLWMDPSVPNSWSGPFQHYRSNPREASFAFFSYILIFVVWVTSGLHIEMNDMVLIDLHKTDINLFKVAMVGYCSSSLFKLIADKYTKKNDDVPVQTNKDPELSA